MAKIVRHNIRPIGFTFHREGHKYHIIGHCYDENRNDKMFIYMTKYFDKYEQWWHYEAITAEQYDFDIKIGVIKEIKQ